MAGRQKDAPNRGELPPRPQALRPRGTGDRGSLGGSRAATGPPAWHQLAEATGRPLRCTVAGIASKDLASRLPVMAAAYAMAFVDGPPVRDDLIVAGIRAADLVVMPVPPKKGDIDRVPSLLKAAANEGTPVLAVLTFTRPDTRQALEAREVLTELGVPVAQTTIAYSMPVADMYGARPRGKLAAYGRDLLAEVLDMLGGVA